jgi:hypothetical protein
MDRPEINFDRSPQQQETASLLHRLDDEEETVHAP